MSGNEGSPDTAVSARRLSIAITRLRSRLRAEAGLHATGLSISQLAVLQQVVDDGPVTAAYLAAAQHVSPQSIAQNLAVLKDEGLVRAGRDPQDGRKILITAADSGRRLLTTLQTSRKVFLAGAIDALVPSEERPDLDKAIELLERLAAADLGDRRDGTA
ncbi:DNA-binding transcriptional regulator, MarR family [Streptomyces sp. DvalAA-14]|uniref:MarR family winged helix-turn-helix transcriptional regulator n=1 Tax=unclassified Streptomyces TaxID=2593676 RepID=UPI00081B13D9|nr:MULTISPECIES: MarR family winged helix-turn-helix transcriptional regulator [unclassified Streptomyces]MYS20331.1 MarR family transcriptional regulator [Streptomyces sp. SID4948]SCD66531.1 DNA-binding transcriptional regulator, MarR family [Streptomyces sp. DvalAA-14]